VPNVELLINGQRWSGWQKIKVVQSIKTAANWFDLTLTDRWEIGSDVMPIKKGSACQVLIDGAPIITGYLFDVLPSYDADSHSINVGGFSKAKDLLDCSLPGQQFNGRTLLQIAQALCQPFGISITAGADIGGAFPAVALEPGEPIFDFLNDLSRLRAVRLISLPDGTISFVQTGTAVSPTPLVYGQNILRAQARFNADGDFSALTVVSQTRGTDDYFGEEAALNSATATTAYSRYRPHTLSADGPANNADCKRRAQAEMNRLAGEGQSISYTVQGWYNAGGLWSPNVLVDVDDPLLNIHDRLLIAQVAFEVDDQGGFLTMLEVQPASAFDLVPLSIDAIPDAVKVRTSKSKRSAL
jgi:prophage tail gpP-like protein